MSAHGPLRIAVAMTVALAGLYSVANASASVASAPSIESESTSNITSTDATLEAQINPQSEERGAYYQFQLAKNPADFASEFTCPTEGFPAGSSLCLGITSQQGAAADSLYPGWHQR